MVFISFISLFQFACGYLKPEVVRKYCYFVFVIEIQQFHTTENQISTIVSESIRLCLNRENEPMIGGDKVQISSECD